LSSNGLQRLEVYSDLPAKCSSLQILNLSENHLHNPADLQSVSGLNSLTTLVLENNPLSQLISQDVVGFAGSLRKLFPNLQTLVLKS
jgi:Leucine-rich repeat (LRR) protein